MILIMIFTLPALLAKGNKPGISPKPASLIRKPVPVKEDQTDSPALPTRPDDKSIPSHRVSKYLKLQ